MSDKNFGKINIKSVISTKFQLLWGTLDIKTKFAQKNLNDENFES